jgi:uncharacterized membrane-anchored protein YhcB (DUF1043 family)
VAEEATINILIQYGLAGVVIYLLFRIVFNDLASIKLELQQIREELKKNKARINSNFNNGYSSIVFHFTSSTCRFINNFR